MEVRHADDDLCIFLRSNLACDLVGSGISRCGLDHLELGSVRVSFHGSPPNIPRQNLGISCQPTYIPKTQVLLFSGSESGIRHPEGMLHTRLQKATRHLRQAWPFCLSRLLAKEDKLPLWNILASIFNHVRVVGV